VDREVELERWREAGKEVGRKLGVLQERERIIKLLHQHFTYKDFAFKDFLIKQINGVNE
jgi:hypothetical protein